MSVNAILVRRKGMECPHCGHENPDHMVYCGGCGERIRTIGLLRPEEPPRIGGTHGSHAHGFGDGLQVQHLSDSALGSIVSVAINVRRIFLVLALGLVVTLSSILFSYSFIYFLDASDIDTFRLVSRIWFSVLAVVIAGGLIYIVKFKKITSL